MKKLIVISVAALAMMLSGCNQNKIAEMENEILSLRTEREIADSLQGKFYEFLSEIEGNLAEIKSREKLISQTTSEKPQNLQEKILQDLADISDLMTKNRNRLAELESLRRQMRAANLNTENMQEMIDALKARVAEQEEQIRELQEKLKIAHERIEVLTTENFQITEDNIKKQAKIDEQIVTLNTAYYTIGTLQSLREAGVITQRGGFIGIGKTRTINEDAALKSFTKIDIREFARLETNSDKIEIITPHAADSYKINNSDPKNLVVEITHPDVFWKSSKYFVVRTR
jgi:vacuolar-type H+-ATPase subunit I/STV1